MGLIAFFLGYPHFGAATWGGVLLSPLIGMLVGELSQSLGSRSTTERVLASLVDLYLAGVLFGLAIGETMFVFAGHDLSGPAIVISPALAVCVAVTLYSWFLWPLAILNHELLWRR